MLKERSRLVFDYLREHQGDKHTLESLDEALNLGVKVINGTLLSLSRVSVPIPGSEEKERICLVERYTDGTTVTDSKGKVKEQKFIRLTDEGLNFDPDKN